MPRAKITIVRKRVIPVPSLGMRIQQRRKDLGLTLAQLASMTELSAGYLSQVENDQAEPSLGALRRIANCLGISTFWLVHDGSEDKNIIVRSDERTRVALNDSPIVYELMTPSLAGRFQVFTAEIKTGEFSVPDYLIHAGEECLVVLEGEVVLNIGDHPYVLRDGDSATYAATLPHRFGNVQPAPARIMLIQLPPRSPQSG